MLIPRGKKNTYGHLCDADYAKNDIHMKCNASWWGNQIHWPNLGPGICNRSKPSLPDSYIFSHRKFSNFGLIQGTSNQGASRLPVNYNLPNALSWQKISYRILGASSWNCGKTFLWKNMGKINEPWSFFQNIMMTETTQTHLEGSLGMGQPFVPGEFWLLPADHYTKPREWWQVPRFLNCV